MYPIKQDTKTMQIITRNLILHTKKVHDQDKLKVSSNYIFNKISILYHAQEMPSKVFTTRRQLSGSFIVGTLDPADGSFEADELPRMPSCSELGVDLKLAVYPGFFQV